MGLKLADQKATKRFEDGDDWIELRVNLTKGERDELEQLSSNLRLPSDEGDASIEVRSQLKQVNRRQFELFCVAWSLDLPITGESYASLDEDSGDWVDDCIDEILAERRKRAEGKAAASKPKRRSSGTASQPAAPST